jgi:hypothetical protein
MWEILRKIPRKEEQDMVGQFLLRAFAPLRVENHLKNRGVVKARKTGATPCRENT